MQGDDHMHVIRMDPSHLGLLEQKKRQFPLRFQISFLVITYEAEGIIIIVMVAISPAITVSRIGGNRAAQEKRASQTISPAI